MAPSAQHIVIMGVAGSGKTTIANLLSKRLGWIAAEADEFHPAVNIAKMTAGTPLDDDDRWPWLFAIRDWMGTQADNGRCTIVTCSALKRTYRDVLAQASGDVTFVHLDGSSEVLSERMKTRTGHFMPPSLLPSQLSTLEPLSPEEAGLRLDITNSPAEIVAAVMHHLGFDAA
ncbi:MULTISPECIES: gluconokinase [unclassified Arthrobacter]|uniref:gluconokinase n=1 Tax=unclassified Arthrobacter TaxID=235627 RepID=UPI001E2906B5|nr:MULTISPECIES: gluconokinase [unclassified Arthrobacter]MCC9144237.1 gluconokinase [Arthrobacter sp. zg-Y919]MDK1275462.1 gluconokinase [Arthrobacter sp. zg.Y919]MDM7991094.1 gluconokinase [Arthrobacter sp. zg-Y877]WIB03158.1 gluconokinase [Arthrobacter sp. zg-Y919]